MRGERKREETMKRSIISIDEEKCNGCGLCIPNCPEGAIQIIDNKARLVSDIMCDGLGACLGHCPQGAITVVEREAEIYDERKVMENIVKQGENTIAAHLEHLKSHNQEQYYNEAVAFLKENGLPVPDAGTEKKETHGGGCPGSRTITFQNTVSGDTTDSESYLTHWPVQLHLISPNAPHYRGSDLLLAADCTAFASGGFHRDFLKGKTLAIACPKLDEGQEIYFDKIKALVDDAKINTLTVVTMQVPCCGGLLNLAKQAVMAAKRKVPVKSIVISLRGEVLKEEWV